MSLHHFSKLPKTGKPTRSEWTILSTIVKDDTKMNTLEVVALGTGTKCIGVNQMSTNGDILNDSHAEIICRRSFLKADDSSTESVACNPKKKVKLDYEYIDIHRTGAKCLPEGYLQDPRCTGVNFHVVNAIRTKPGRGDPTLSVSCSDKIIKWCYLAGKTPYSSNALERALITRFEEVAIGDPFRKHCPSIQQSNFAFEFEKNDKKSPCPASISWWRNTRKPEISVDGKKQGITKKMKKSKESRSSLIPLFHNSSFGLVWLKKQ
ncbi:hypothetical protein Trydic_g16589 [Trypoxylus dichotomus]